MILKRTKNEIANNYVAFQISEEINTYILKNSIRKINDNGEKALNERISDRLYRRLKSAVVETIIREKLKNHIKNFEISLLIYNGLMISIASLYCCNELCIL